MKLRIALALSAILTLSACLAITGGINYTDPKTGATVGFQVGNAPDGKTIKRVKAGPSFRANTHRVQLR